MQTVTRILRKTIVYLAVVVLAGGAPLAQVVAADTAPAKSGGYTYNSDTQHWDSKTWRWDPAQNKYVKITATSSPSPSPSASPTPKNSSAPEGTSASTAQTTAPAGSDATVTENTNGTATTNDNTGASVTNNLDSNASTGSANVHRNTSAGDARTGSASADTTIINSVHSTVGDGDNSGVARFTTNLYGDILGDITIGPNIDNARIDKNTNLSSTTNVNNNDQLVNNQTLQATSGNASVRGNTTGGSAVSGNANSVANVLNLINTIVAANKSFIGTINIYGNLNGDILVSPDFIPQLLASNNAQVVGNYNMPLSMTTNDDQSIVNNVKLNATTGTAAVKNNTTAGSAQTGTAQTNLTILNLTGHQVDAKKSLLVFVNVLGKWVGMIVDAPGATSAALGSGVISDNTTLSSTANLNNTVGITNNLDLSSASGNATVAGNTKGGDAITGNATASANIANISTSQFNLSDWFGVLYINVFGSWIGSFGIDTVAGTVTPLSGDAVAASAGVAGAPNLHFGFRPATHTSSALSSGGGAGSSGGDTAGLVSGMQTSREAQPILQAGTSPHEDPFSLVMMITGFTIAGASGIFWIIRRWAVYRTAVA